MNRKILMIPRLRHIDTVLLTVWHSLKFDSFLLLVLWRWLSSDTFGRSMTANELAAVQGNITRGRAIPVIIPNWLMASSFDMPLSVRMAGIRIASALSNRCIIVWLVLIGRENLIICLNSRKEQEMFLYIDLLRAALQTRGTIQYKLAASSPNILPARASAAEIRGTLRILTKSSRLPILANCSISCEDAGIKDSFWL